MLDPRRLLESMPISLWLYWRAYFKMEGPSEARRSDFHAANLALQVAAPHIDEDKRELRNFLSPWAKPSDYRKWANLGEDDPDRMEFTAE